MEKLDVANTQMYLSFIQSVDELEAKL